MMPGELACFDPGVVEIGFLTGGREVAHGVSGLSWARSRRRGTEGSWSRRRQTITPGAGVGHVSVLTPCGFVTLVTYGKVADVSSTAEFPDGAELEALVRLALERPQSPIREAPARWAIVDAAHQRLIVLDRDRALAAYPVSTAAAGIGGQSGSYRTPPGWHRVHARIGEDQPLGTVFESRAATGAHWNGEAEAADLVLTRILTLDGLEPGVNQGAEVDSLARYIYLHGTNHESRLGEPCSHGCVRLSNADMLRAFDALQDGDPVVIVGEAHAALDSRDESARSGAPPILAPLPDPFGPVRFHYAGLGGSGMSALAQFQTMAGGVASGSDRAFDRGERKEQRAQLERLGITIAPQDGSGVTRDCAALVVSSAVEAEVPDVVAARALQLPIVHRSALLAHFVAARRTIAVAGTSGKSSVVGMIFEMLRGAGRDPSVITGGELIALQRDRLAGNAWAGSGKLLVVEADESDGSLVRYQPAVAVVLNLQKDHRAMDEVQVMFRTFERRALEAFVCGDDPALAALRREAAARGLDARSFAAVEAVELDPDGSEFTVAGVRFRLPAPGAHNLENARAAIAACQAVGVPLDAMVTPLAEFQGVARRFQQVGRGHGVEVIDDFAHNPAKLRAAIATAQRRAARVFAIYQAHGYGPTRFLRPDLVQAFAEALRPEDRLWLLEIFYAGGTAVRDFSAADLVAEVSARGARAEFAPTRGWLVDRLATETRPGDLVLVMGARDPSLSDFALEIATRLGLETPVARAPSGS
ncbi:MAG: L,D-transpeptidase family protein [Candidatus Eisenbacteria bacterium]|uniref:L,D-transpeptidase family protein n=1 Tax=Eiseniibacteriota bacterium TaxID=2212470 RepID=A0A849SIE0_UNCEI|nr:L,D-transpeptidase family protein [Candidatus Eisenbacteria bacterium]